MADNDPAPKPEDNKPPVDDKSGGDKGGDSKTLTQEQVDKVVQERLAKAEKAAEERTKKAVADALAEAERKAQMSAEDRAKEESKKKTDELATKERDLALRENRADARELLAKESVPTELVDYIVDVDADKTKENAEQFITAFKKAVEDGVKAKLSGDTPEDFSGDDKSKGDKKKSSSGDKLEINGVTVI